MARDSKTDQKRPEADVAAQDAPIETAPAPTQFVQTGAIPPVDTTATKPAPTASERAYGKGVQALEAMLAKGTPKASDVASLVDAHRDEHDQILAMVQQKLGDAFVASVRADLSGPRASIPNKELAVGDPGDPNADYLDVSQAQGGAKWKAAGGNFTGTADKNGLDTTVKTGANDAIHAQVKPDKSGTVDWNHDGKPVASLAGHYKDGKNYDGSLSRTQDVDGASVTEGVKHQVADGKTSDNVYTDVKKGDTTAHADVGLSDGKPAEHLSASTKLGKSDQITGSVGHDGKGTTAEIKDTHDFSSTTKASLDVSDKAGTLAETGTLKTKTDDFSETVSKDKKGTTAEVKDTHDFGGGTTANVDLKDTQGALSESASVTHKGKSDSETASVAHDAKGTTLHAAATDQINKQLSVEGHLDETLAAKGKNQTVLETSEKYDNGKVVEGLSVEGGKGAKDYLKATGSVDAQLAPNLYGGAWGSYGYEAGKQNTAQFGASLTFTHDEQQALTLAGVIDQSGRIETRLQFDVFKDRINSVSALDQHKKDAMLSLFVSYSQQVGGKRALDDRLGAPELETGNASQVMAGIRIRF